MAKKPLPNPAQGEDEIVQKKPSAPVEITLLIITFIALVVGIYINWEALGRMYFDTKMYEEGASAKTVYDNWSKSPEGKSINVGEDAEF